MNERKLPRPRPEMAQAQPYRTQQQKADVRINANEWPEPNAAGRHITAAELDDVLLNRYPGRGDELRTVLSARWGTQPDRMIIGNGSNECLLQVFLVFGGHNRKTLLFHPTYSMHGRLTQLAGGTVVQETIGLPYEVTKERALAAMTKARPEIVAFTTPNNPTGNTIDDDVILTVAERYPETLVLVDEAYSDFAGTSLVSRMDEFPNMVISKTFSKVLAAAGLRVGVLLVHPDLMGYFTAAALPYNVSTLTLAVATRIARDDSAVEHRLALAATERQRVLTALRRVSAIEVFPSVTNFILFRLREGKPADVHARLLEHSVLIRDISIWPGCEGCLRASIGTPLENDRFIAALDSVFASPAAHR
ncbi:MAG TPA: histidinol-phosphate transaminase [Candidatus Limnocylindria bacterium]|jgi:histidinol-phosphate aminotransferase|nr:histidinol-phosphate transaminase [Candidatus Limnocylindria bacterium]